MKFVLITKDQDMVKEAREGFHPGDEFLHFENWEEALNNSEGVDLLFVDCQMMSDEQFKEKAENLRKGELYGKLPSSKDFLQIGTAEVKSPKEIWAEKILKSNKPADYEQVMRVANIEADKVPQFMNIPKVNY